MTLVIVVSRPHCSYCDRKIKQAESSIHIATTTNKAASLGQKSAKPHKKTYYRLLVICSPLQPFRSQLFASIRSLPAIVRRLPDDGWSIRG
jgi:hypothetical protein